jgi:hypothetical protein
MVTSPEMSFRIRRRRVRNLGWGNLPAPPQTPRFARGDNRKTLTNPADNRRQLYLTYRPTIVDMDPPPSE